MSPEGPLIGLMTWREVELESNANSEEYRHQSGEQQADVEV